MQVFDDQLLENENVEDSRIYSFIHLYTTNLLTWSKKLAGSSIINKLELVANLKS